MKVRIFETDFDGRPVACTGEWFEGQCALDIVEAMQMNPFTAGMAPRDFMNRILAAIGKGGEVLPEDAGKAAEVFLGFLEALGYCEKEEA